MRKLEGFIISLIFIIGMAFLAQMFIVKPDSIDIAKGFIPTGLSNQSLYIAIGIIGATVMPHNLYLHSSLVQTRKIDHTEEGIKTAIRFNFWDTTIALNLAFLVNSAILILAASAFFGRGYHEVAEIQDAHKLLTNIFGKLAPALFAIALIAAGQSSTVTGTLAGQIIMEGHLNLRIAPWLRRLLTRILAIVPAFFTILYAGEQALGKLLILSQVILSLQLGFAIIPLIHFTSDKKRMGNFATKMPLKILAWIFAVLIVGLNVRLVIQEINTWAAASPGSANLVHYLISPIAGAVGLLLIYVFLRPLFYKRTDQRVYVPHGIANVLDNLEAVHYNNIGVTIDFSKNDQDCIRHALMQGGKKAHYTLIHVVETAGARYYGKQVMDNETQSDVDNLNKYVSTLVNLGYKTEAKIGYGSPATSIAEIINQLKIDFLVMGSHGHKTIKDLIFGTTVNSVRHMVNIPVLVIKPQKK
jgi:manganese transport protein